MVEFFKIMAPVWRVEESHKEAREQGCLAIVLQIPWAMIAPHEGQAYRNHSQTLERLDQRGGLDAAEAIAVLEDRAWRRMGRGEANTMLLRMVEDWIAADNKKVDA